MSQPTTKKYVNRRQLFELLRDGGLPPHSMSMLNKLSAPSCGLGPRIACYSGKRPLYLVTEALAWSESLLAPTKGALMPHPPAPEQPTPLTPPAE